MPLTNLIKHSNIFIETGTLFGDGIKKALESGYEKIHSIEICDYYYEMNKNQFSNNDKVYIHKGDSSLILFDIIKNINEKITFWLDGHYMACDPEQKENLTFCKKTYPILEELDLISLHHIKNHTIMIDDMNEVLREINIDIIKEKIFNINKNYIITFITGQQENEILLATVDK